MRFALIVTASILAQIAAFAVAFDRYLGAMSLSPMVGGAVIVNPLTPRSLEEVFLMASGIAFLSMTLGLVWVILQARQGFAYILSMASTVLLWQIAVRLMRSSEAAIEQASVCSFFVVILVFATWRLLASASKPVPARN